MNAFSFSVFTKNDIIWLNEILESPQFGVHVKVNVKVHFKVVGKWVKI